MSTRMDSEVFKERSCLSLNEIKDYTANRLEGDHLHSVESHITSCELCNDAIEGYMAVPAFDLSSDLGRKGRGTPNWTNTATRLVIGAGVLLGVYFMAEQFANPPQQTETTKETEGVVLYDPEEELIELNEEVERAREIPAEEQVGHQLGELIITPAANEKTVPKEVLEPAQKIVRDTSNTTVNISTQLPNVAEIKPAKPRPILKRLPVSNRQLLFLNQLKLVHPSEIYNALGSADQLTGTPASHGIDQDEGIVTVQDYTYVQILEMATEAYWKEEHKDATKLWNLWLSKHPKDVNCLFYVGLCYYNLGLYDKAFKNLEAARLHEIDTFSEEATWYSALSYEKIHGLEASRDKLEKIALLGGFYSKRAHQKLNP